MLNQVVMLGRVKEIKENSIIITNDNTNFEILVSDDMLNNTKEYLNINDLVGIKAKLGENNTIICERLTFLSSKQNEYLQK